MSVPLHPDMVIPFIDRVITPPPLMRSVSSVTFSWGTWLLLFRPRLIYYTVACIGITLEILFCAGSYDESKGRNWSYILSVVRTVMVLALGFVQYKSLFQSIVCNITRVDVLMKYQYDRASITNDVLILIMLSCVEIVGIWFEHRCTFIPK